MTFTWFDIPKNQKVRVAKVLSGWENTPYSEGQRAKRMGADCVQLVVGVLDDLFRMPEKTRIPRVSFDSALHKDSASFPALKALRGGWFGSFQVDDGTVEPGDLVVTKGERHPNAPNRQAHVMIAGSEPWTALHTLPLQGARITSLQATADIITTYRMKEKNRWADPSFSSSTP